MPSFRAHTQAILPLWNVAESEQEKLTMFWKECDPKASHFHLKQIKIPSSSLFMKWSGQSLPLTHIPGHTHWDSHPSEGAPSQPASCLDWQTDTAEAHRMLSLSSEQRSFFPLSLLPLPLFFSSSLPPSEEKSIGPIAKYWLIFYSNVRKKSEEVTHF